MPECAVTTISSAPAARRVDAVADAAVTRSPTSSCPSTTSCVHTGMPGFVRPMTPTRTGRGAGDPDTDDSTGTATASTISPPTIPAARGPLAFDASTGKPFIEVKSSRTPKPYSTSWLPSAAAV